MAQCIEVGARFESEGTPPDEVWSGSAAVGIEAADVEPSCLTTVALSGAAVCLVLTLMARCSWVNLSSITACGREV